MKRLAVLFTVLCLCLCACGESQANTEENAALIEYQGEAVKGYAAADGNVYIPAPDGTIISVQPQYANYKVRTAWLTPDCKTIVSVQETESYDLVLCYADFSQTNYRSLGRVFDIYSIQNEGIIYRGDGSFLKRCFFDEESTVQNGGLIPALYSVTVADHTLSCGFEVDDVVYAWPHDKEGPIEIGTYKDSKMYLISGDGKTLLWTGESDALFMHQNGKTVTLTTFSRNPYGWETVDGTLRIFRDSYDSGDFFIQRPGQDIQIIDKGSSGVWRGFCTKTGPLYLCTAKEADTIYALFENTLYAIDQNNELLEIGVGISQFSIYGNRIVYIQNHRLFFAAFENNKIEDPLQVAVDVDQYETNDNQQIYYTKKTAGSKGYWLYEIDYDDKESREITYYVYDYYLDAHTGWLFYIKEAWDYTENAPLWDIWACKGQQKPLKVQDSYDGELSNGLPWNYEDLNFRSDT